MPFQVPPLPFETHALEPYISKDTIETHYFKHHLGYLEKLNRLVENTEFADASLEDIIMRAKGPIFNNGAQVWNHTFYWKCMSTEKTRPEGDLEKAILGSFGSLEKFYTQFAESCRSLFGSGWVWLVKGNQGYLTIEKLKDADNPLRSFQQPILVCDVWEHAYYLDYRNERDKYVEAFEKIINWKFAKSNYEADLEEIRQAG